MTEIKAPYNVFFGEDGYPLEGGYIFIGLDGLNPLSNPQQAYWDPALTIPAANVRTSGGRPSNNGAVGRLYVPGDYSILVQDKNGRTVYSQLEVTFEYMDLLLTKPRGTLSRSAREPPSFSMDSILESGIYTWANGATTSQPATCAAGDLFLMEVLASPDGTGVVVQRLTDLTRSALLESASYERKSFDAGVTWQAWLNSDVARSRPVGELFFSEFDETPSVDFPAIKRWISDQDISATNYPLLVPKYRAKKAAAWSGSAYVTDHTVTVAASVLTGSGTAWDNLLAALAEDVAVHGSYTSWLCINVAGTDYAITNVNTGAHTVTVSGSPATGSQTASVYPHRIAGSTTTARLLKLSGRALMSPDGTLRIAGTRRRHHMQGHYHAVYETASNTYAAYNVSGRATGVESWAPVAGDAATRAKARDIQSDGVNGTPITGPETEPNSATAFIYTWAGAYI